MHEKIHFSQPVIIFDGVCNLCNGFVNFIIKSDKRAKFKFLALQNPKAQPLFKILSGNEMLIQDLSTVVLLDKGHFYLRSDAVLRIASYLPFPLRGLKYFSFIPRQLRDMIYNFIAKHRYQWFGKKPRCMIPTPDVMARFIE